MFLNNVIGKPLIFRQKPQHICIGVALEKKSGKLKYLICLNEVQRTEFALPFNSVLSITNSAILISSLRSAIMKNVYVIKRELPVYSTQGEYVGILEDACLFQNRITALIINNKRYPYERITGVLDAILLSPAPLYPLGQRIPAPNEYNTEVVNKHTLKKVINDNKLIPFTLSLPPFSFTMHL